MNFAFVLASNSIGISAMTYPSAIAKSGVITFIILMTLAIIINYASGYLLVWSAKHKKAKNYTHLTEIMLGKYKIIVDLAFFITNLGIMISCIMTFNESMSSLFSRESFGHANPLLTHEKSLFWIILPTLLLLPILNRRSLADLSLCSTAAVISIFFLSLFCVYIYSVNEYLIDFSKINWISTHNSATTFILLLFGFMN